MRSFKRILSSGRKYAKSSTQHIRNELNRKRANSKALERELRRKEKALAETAALLLLRGKAEVIWGDNEGQ
jgi:hypothetical protein